VNGKSMVKYTVSVIIPTYNRWPRVATAIDSVLAQSHPNTRCIVVDDASTDTTCEQIAERYGEQVKLIRNERNQEKSVCRNCGVREADSEFVCFLDSDDLLTRDSVADRIRVFASDPSFDGVAFGANRHQREAQQPVPAVPAILGLDEYLNKPGQLQTNSFLLRRTAMLRFGMYNERLTNREDIELFIRLLARLEFRNCGTLVSFFGSAGPDRARDNWGKIIAQGTALTEAIAGDPHTLSTLGERYRQLRAEECGELLRAFYRSGSFTCYRRKYRAARSEGILPFSIKGFRRYCIASLRSVATALRKVGR
jgi:glycosyltransferase involved in cell wall biosynthesis